MIIWIERHLALAIHDRQLAEHGGSPGVRDANLLESALAWPQQLFAYGDPLPDLADLAATLAHGLVRNHPFIDGNKRTAYVVYRTFLVLNDAELSASDEEKYLTIIALAEGKLSIEEFSGWLRSRLHVRPGDSVQESRRRYRTIKKTKRKKTART